LMLKDIQTGARQTRARRRHIVRLAPAIERIHAILMLRPWAAATERCVDLLAIIEDFDVDETPPPPGSLLPLNGIVCCATAPSPPTRRTTPVVIGTNILLMPGLSHSDLIKLLTVFPAGADLRAHAACSFEPGVAAGDDLRRRHALSVSHQQARFREKPACAAKQLLRRASFPTRNTLFLRPKGKK
jgi:hypothetical protein